MNAKKQTVIINGKTYDMATGKALTAPNAASAKVKTINDIAPNRQNILAKKPAPAKKARAVAPHARTNVQKSTTLRRNILKQPASTVRPAASKIHRSTQKSERITKFAPEKIQATRAEKHKVDHDLAAQTRELEKAHAEYVAATRQGSAHISSRTVKEHLLQKAVQQVPAEPTSTHTAARASKSRFASAAMTSLALVMLGGYLTYINIPNLSIRVAAANTGIDASLPAYQPAGYKISGPIGYGNGEVNVNYKAANSSQGYKLTQRPTDWDPVATLDNYVESDSNSDYQIRSVQGLTVYTYDKKAVWVDGGILHVIDGNATLSSQQVERIVASM